MLALAHSRNLAASPVCVVRLSDGESAEGDVHDGVPRGDEAVEQAERRSHQQRGPVAGEAIHNEARR